MAEASEVDTRDVGVVGSISTEVGVGVHYDNSLGEIILYFKRIRRFLKLKNSY